MQTHRFLRAALLLLAAVSSTVAAQTERVRLELLSEPTLRLQLSEVREAPVRVRVVRDSDGSALPDVKVQFGVFASSVVCVPGQPCTQPNPMLYGSYVPAGSGVTVASDAQGVAVAPAFRAGSVAGVYELDTAVYLTAGQNYTTMGSTPPRVQILQGNAAPFPPGSHMAYPPDAVPSHIPVNGPWALALMLLAMVLSAAWFLRGR